MPALDYRRLFESAPLAAVVLDRDLHVVVATDAFLRVTLTKRDAIAGRPLFELFPSEEGEPVVRKLLERVLAERQPQRLALQRYDLPRPAAEGGGFVRRYWRADFLPVAGPDGEVAQVHCIIEDVTDQARETRLRQLLAVEGVGVIFFDRHGTLISANDTFLRWTGYTPAEVAAGGLTWRTFTPPEYVERSLQQLEKMHATGRIGPYEKEYLAKDGRRGWML